MVYARLHDSGSAIQRADTANALGIGPPTVADRRLAAVTGKDIALLAAALILVLCAAYVALALAQ